MDSEPYLRNPPWLGSWLLCRLKDYAENYASLGDFEEEYNHHLKTHGRCRAWCWYWVQVLIATPKYLTRWIYWRIAMFSNYFKIAYRNIKKHKGYSFIKLKPEVDAENFERQIAPLPHEYAGEELEKRGLEYRNFLFPVKDIHLHSISGDRIKPSANLIYVYIFSTVGARS